MVYAGDGPYRRSRGTEAEDIEIAAGRGLSPRPAPATTRPGVRTAPRRVRASATTHRRPRRVTPARPSEGGTSDDQRVRADALRAGSRLAGTDVRGRALGCR